MEMRISRKSAPGHAKSFVELEVDSPHIRSPVRARAANARASPQSVISRWGRGRRLCRLPEKRKPACMHAQVV